MHPIVLLRASLGILLTLAGVALAQDPRSFGYPASIFPSSPSGASAGASGTAGSMPGSVSGPQTITNVPIPTTLTPQILPPLPGLPGTQLQQPSTVPALVQPLKRNEFQDFIVQTLGRDLPLFGYDLFVDVPSTFAPVDRIPVTPDYIVGPGDEIQIRAWGQVDIDYRAVVDRNGTIGIPKIGTVNVAGIRYQELQGYLKNAIGRVFRNFELNVTLGQLRSIQVFVVGQARRSGSYTVSSLSTLVNALFASGGPSEKGSMRRIQLKRGSRIVSEFDLYDLLLKGDKSKDAALLPGDVIYIPPIGPLAAITGSVSVPAIYELRDRASLSELIDWAGGLATTAAGQKVTLERTKQQQSREVENFDLDQAGLSREIRNGDLVTVYALSPRISNAVSLRGFVAQPARFPWRQGLRVKDLIPDREALISPDYWLRRNALIRSEDWLRRPLDVGQGGPVQNTLGQGGSVQNPAGPGSFLQGPGGQNQNLSQTQFRAELKRSEEINWDYAVVERIRPEDMTTQLIPFNLGKAVLDGEPAQNIALAPGDLITVFSKSDIQVPVARQTKYVRVEGEVVNPGVYQLAAGETLRQLVTRIGGLTRNAYLYGAEFTRESTRSLQQKRLDEALDRLAQEIERNAVGIVQASVSKDETDSAKVQADSQRRLLARLRDVKANGRIVLDLGPERGQLRDVPDMVLDDGDRFLVPPLPSVIGVIGSVYNQNTFIYEPGKKLSNYLEQAGGPTRDADTGRVYVVRADGTVIGQGQSFIFSGYGNAQLMPGDTIVVPEDLDRFRFTRAVKDWTQVFYQFALGVAGIKVLKGL